LICSWPGYPRDEPWKYIKSTKSHDGGTTTLLLDVTADPDAANTSLIPGRRRQSTSFSSGTHNLSPGAFLTLQPPASTLILKDPISQMLFTHYKTRTSNCLSAYNDARNSFMTELPKLAFEYPNTVMQSLLAISGLQYLNGRENADVRYQTLSHRQQALATLKHGLTRLNYGLEKAPTTLELLVTALVLCYVEVSHLLAHPPPPNYIHARLLLPAAD
jgi:hypothetical protein